MHLRTKEKWFLFLNMIELLGVLFILFLAFAFQFIFHELPCPLCLLQRVGLIGVCVGLLLNLRFYAHPSHYALAMLSALLTAFVALRQVALHVVPGTGAYASAFLGYHLYTWSFILSMVIVIYTCIILSLEMQYAARHVAKTPLVFLRNLCFVLVLFIAGANAVSVFFECGLTQCPDNPTQYMLLHH